MFSPGLDTLFLNLLRRKKHPCTSCGDRIRTCSPNLEYPVIEPVILSDVASIRWLAASAELLHGWNPFKA